MPQLRFLERKRTMVGSSINWSMMLDARKRILSSKVFTDDVPAFIAALALWKMAPALFAMRKLRISYLSEKYR